MALRYWSAWQCRSAAAFVELDLPRLRSLSLAIVRFDPRRVDPETAFTTNSVARDDISLHKCLQRKYETALVAVIGDADDESSNAVADIEGAYRALG